MHTKVTDKEGVEVTTHIIERGLIRVAGYTTPDRDLPGGSSSWVDRVKPPFRHDIRLLVEGSRWYAGFGLGAVDPDLWYNLGAGLSTQKGPHLYGYGMAGVIDTRGGTGAEIKDEEASGRLLRVKVGDYFAIEDVGLFKLDWYRQGSYVDMFNIAFELDPCGAEADNG